MDTKGEVVESLVRTFDINELDRTGVAAAVQCGIGHRLNNAITPIEFFEFIPDDRAKELKSKIMLVSGCKNFDLNELVQNYNENEDLVSVARDACKHYADQYIERLRSAGFEGDNANVVLENWKGEVSRRYKELELAVGENDEDLQATKNAWNRVSTVVGDIVSIAYGESDLPPIQDYQDGRQFFDFGRIDSSTF